MAKKQSKTGGGPGTNQHQVKEVSTVTDAPPPEGVLSSISDHSWQTPGIMVADKRRGHSLAPREGAPLPYSTEDTSLEQKVIHERYFGKGGQEWLLAEYDPDTGLAFGYCDLGMGFPEWGYFSLSELSLLADPKLRLPLIERDLYFCPKKFDQVKFGANAVREFVQVERYPEDGAPPHEYLKPEIHTVDTLSNRHVVQRGDGSYLEVSRVERVDGDTTKTRVTFANGHSVERNSHDRVDAFRRSSLAGSMSVNSQRSVDFCRRLVDSAGANGRTDVRFVEDKSGAVHIYAETPETQEWAAREIGTFNLSGG